MANLNEAMVGITVKAITSKSSLCYMTLWRFFPPPNHGLTFTWIDFLPKKSRRVSRGRKIEQVHVMRFSLIKAKQFCPSFCKAKKVFLPSQNKIMSTVALRGQGRAVYRRGISAVGCSYIPQQQYRVGNLDARVARRQFSSSQRIQIFENVKGFFESAKNSTYQKLGLQTPNEKEMEGLIQSMRPKTGKGLIRQQRKRWSRPETVVDAKTGEKSTRILEHKYSTAYFRISPRKLQLLADQIGSGKPIDYAILQMQFSQKRASKRIKSTLVLARDHAVAKGLDASRLVVSEAWVGKGRTFKKMEIKGRGRMGIRKSFQAKMSIVLREGTTWDVKQKEKLAKEKKRVRSIGTGGVVRTNLPVRNTFQRPGWQW